MRRFFALLLVLTSFLVDCIASSPHSACSSYESSARIHYSFKIDSTFSQSQRELILTALEEWRNPTAPVFSYDLEIVNFNEDDVRYLLTEKERYDSVKKNEIFIMVSTGKDVPDQPSWVGYHTNKWVINFIGIINERLVQQSPELYRDTVVHEIGHAFGLDHNDKQYESVMTPVVNYSSGCITQYDLDNICNLWCCDSKKLTPCEVNTTNQPFVTDKNYY